MSSYNSSARGREISTELLGKVADERSAQRVPAAPADREAACVLSDFQSAFGAVVVDDDQYQRYLASGKRDFHDFVRAEEAVSRFIAGERHPPNCNTGGNSNVGNSVDDELLPRPNISGDAAFVDYLRFTVSVSSPSVDRSHLDRDIFIVDLFDNLKRLFNVGYGSRRDFGRWFYKCSYTFLGTNSGGVYIGGNRNTCCVDLPGSICARVKDWNAVSEWLREIGAVITRVDIARDCLGGEYTLGDARGWYQEGGFTINRRPSASFIDDMGSGKGCTFYVGSRDNGKLLRVYEKGKQLGDKYSPWVRFELELKNRDRFIPLDIVTNPGGYLSGAYPCLSWIDGVQERVKTLSKALKVSYEKLKAEAKKAYGRLINFMVDAGFSSDEIVGDLINRDGFPGRMKVPLFSLGCG